MAFNEEAALQISSCKSKDEFVASADKKELLFPTLAAIRVVRSIKEVDGKKIINMVAVQAAHLNLGQQVTKSAQDLIPALQVPTDALLPAEPASVQTSPHYGFQVSCPNGTMRTGQQLLALLRSSGKSTTAMVGEGYAVRTEGLVDAAGMFMSKQEPPKKFAVTGFCDLSIVTDFKLDPPKGAGKGYGLRTSEFDYVVNQFWHIEDAQEEAAFACFSGLLSLGEQVRGKQVPPSAGQCGQMRTPPWQ